MPAATARHGLAALGLLLLVAWTGRPAAAAEYTFAVKPAPEGLKEAQFWLWVPDGLKADERVRGILCASKYEAGTGLYTDPQWRAAAERLKAACLLYQLDRPEAELRLSKDKAAAEAILAALKHFANEAKRPELAHAGLVLTGLSQSGWQAVAFANHIPDRVIAAIPYHEATPNRAADEAEKSAALGVPQLHVMGGNCSLTPAIHTWIPKACKGGALWSSCVQPGVPHHKMGDQEFILAWLEAVFNLRVPKDTPADKPYALSPLKEQDGWLGTLKLAHADIPNQPRLNAVRTTVTSAEVWRFADFKGDKAEAVWLPTEAVAKAWLAYSKQDGRP